MEIKRTPSRRKPAAKDNAHLLQRLRHIKAQPIDPNLLKVIVGKRALTSKEATQVEAQIQAMLAEADRVKRTRAELEQIPSLVQPGVLL